MRLPAVLGLVAIACGVSCTAGSSTAASFPTPTSTASPAATENTLRVQGPLATDSSREVVGSGRGCSFGPPLLFATNAMSLASGRVLRLSFTIDAQASSPGVYSGTAPLQEYGYTPLTIGVANNSTTGAGNRINATSGEVTVTRADAANGLFLGSVDAQFADGTHVTGGWLCRVGE